MSRFLKVLDAALIETGVAFLKEHDPRNDFAIFLMQGLRPPLTTSDRETINDLLFKRQCATVSDLTGLRRCLGLPSIRLR